MTRVLVVSDSMLKDHVGFFTLRSAASVEVIAFPGIRIEKVFPLVSQKLQGVDILVLHVGTNNVGECAATRFCRFRTLTSKLLDVNPTVRLVLSATLPRQMSLRKNDKWALTPEDLESCNSEAVETNLLLQELCRKEGHLYLDGSGEPWPRLVKLGGVHPNKRGSECVACIVQVLGQMLWRGIRQAVLQVHGCREEQVWRDHIVQAEHEELLRQYGDQTNLMSEHWLGETNFPRL
ncbi:uncharacterized protein LOC144168095 [Haemaphysalis longicornis]